MTEPLPPPRPDPAVRRDQVVAARIKAWFLRLPAIGKVGVIILAVLVAVGVLAALGSTGSMPSSDDGDPYAAYVACQQQLEQQMKAPSTADWPALSDVQVTHVSETFTMAGYVDAENSFGAKIRATWTCKATHETGDQYVVSAILSG
jgi:hypothetical protein